MFNYKMRSSHTGNNKSARAESREPREEILKGGLDSACQQTNLLVFNKKEFKLKGSLSMYSNTTINKLRVKVFVDESTQRAKEKYQALVSATHRILSKFPNAFDGLPAIEIYFGSDIGAEACWSPDSSAGTPYLILGDRTLFRTNKKIAGQDDLWGMGALGPRGVADQMYDKKRLNKTSPIRWFSEIMGVYSASKYEEKVTAVIIHELGHIIHGCNPLSLTTFWKNKKIGARLVSSRIAEQVSSYTQGNNHNEFVAEVFTGIACGKLYSPEVIDLYEMYGGPRPSY